MFFKREKILRKISIFYENIGKNDQVLTDTLAKMFLNLFDCK